MYAEMTRRMQQKDVEKKKLAEKMANLAMADSEVSYHKCRDVGQFTAIPFMTYTLINFFQFMSLS